MGLIYFIIVAVVIILGVGILIALMDRPKKTPKQELRDDPLYREFVTLARDVAHYNLTVGSYEVVVPVELAKRARELLDQEKKESRKQ